MFEGIAFQSHRWICLKIGGPKVIQYLVVDHHFPIHIAPKLGGNISFPDTPMLFIESFKHIKNPLEPHF